MEEGATDALDHTSPSARRRGGRDALDAPDHPPAPPAVTEGGRPGRDGITTRGRSRGRMGRARISTPPPPPWRKGKGGAVPDPPQRQRAAGEGTPRTRRDHHHQRRSRGGSGRPGRAGPSTSTRRRGGMNVLDILDHLQRQHGTGTPSGPLLPPVLIYLFVFPFALLALASEHKKAALKGRPY